MPTARNMVKALDSVESVEGFLTPSEMKFLYLAGQKLSKHGDIVEIGSWKGKSTICLALGARGSKARVYAVDPHIGSREKKDERTFNEFKKNIRRFGVQKIVVPRVMKSLDAALKWSKPISMLWIDGSHEYDDVKTDFEMWEKFLMDGGLIAFHDSFHSGPSRIIMSIIKSRNYSTIGHIDYVTFAIKGVSRGRKFHPLYFKLLKNFVRTEFMQPKWLNEAVKRRTMRDFRKLESVK